MTLTLVHIPQSHLVTKYETATRPDSWPSVCLLQAWTGSNRGDGEGVVWPVGSWATSLTYYVCIREARERERESRWTGQPQEITIWSSNVLYFSKSHTLVVIKGISQYLNVKKYCRRATGQTLRIQIAGRNKSFQSLVLVLTQLHFGQWSSLPAKFDCPVARQSFSLLATAHDSETSLQCLAKTHPSYCYYCSPMRMSLLI